jgi:hypothetical protein
MTSTIEISFYPLNKDYPLSVVSFLQKLKVIPDIETKTNGMSTVLIGSYEILWQHLGELINLQFSEEDCVFVLKVAPGRREYVE